MGFWRPSKEKDSRFPKRGAYGCLPWRKLLGFNMFTSRARAGMCLFVCLFACLLACLFVCLFVCLLQGVGWKELAFCRFVAGAASFHLCGAGDDCSGAAQEVRDAGSLQACRACLGQKQWFSAFGRPPGLLDDRNGEVALAEICTPKERNDFQIVAPQVEFTVLWAVFEWSQHRIYRTHPSG